MWCFRVLHRLSCILNRNNGVYSAVLVIYFCKKIKYNDYNKRNKETFKEFENGFVE